MTHGDTSTIQSVPAVPIAKVATKNAGLDEVLEGGIPSSGFTLLIGGPGTGKTVLGLEFLVRNGQAGHPGVLITFEETEAAMRRLGLSFGWDLADLEARHQLAIVSARIQPDAVLTGDFDLQGILALLAQKIQETKAQHVFIDAPDALLRLLNDVAKERAQLHILSGWLSAKGLTTLMTVKREARYDFLEYSADCVICLDQRVSDQVATRRLRVSKYRGSSFSRNEYPFSISDVGVWIIPVTRANLQHRALGDDVPTGIRGLDLILGGGYRRSSCTLIGGSSGTGKTTLACAFVTSAIDKGDRVLHLDYEESWDALVSCMTSTGIDLSTAHDSGRLRFVSAMPEGKGIEEHLVQAFQEIERFEPTHLVVDAISACRRMGSSHAAFDFLLRLIDHCKQRGITSLLTNLGSARDENEITGIDMSSVIDTVILLANTKAGDRFVRSLHVLKSRGRAHSDRVHPFRITGRGIEFVTEESLHAV